MTGTTRSADLAPSRSAGRIAEPLARLTASSRGRAVLVYTVIALAGAVAAYYAIFSQFAGYDDEGTLLTTLKAFADGHTLYRDIYTPYGPFYYEIFGGFFALTGKSVSTDASRLIVVAVWTGASLLFGLAVHRITHRLALGVAAMAVVYTIAQVLVHEPMHPVGLIVLLLAALTLAIVVTPPRWVVGGGILAGAIAAALLLTKVNIGLFAIAAAALAAVSVSPGLRRRAWVRLPVVAAYVVMPVVLMRSDLDVGGWRDFAFVVTAAGAAVAAVSAFGPTEAAERGSPGIDRWLRWALGGFAAATAVILVTIFATGASPGAIWQDTVVQATRQRNIFTILVALPHTATIWAVVALGAALVVRRLRAADERPSPAGGAARLAVGLVIWLSPLGAAPFGLSTAPLSVLLALAWVAALPPRGIAFDSRFAPLARALLPALAVAESLQAYPVAGTQLDAAELVYVPVGAICLYDGWRVLEAWAATRPRSTVVRMRAIGSAGGMALAVAFVWSGIVSYGITAQRSYRTQPAFPIGGATRLHLPPDQTGTYTRLAYLIRQNGCTALVGLPSTNSLYLWSFLDAPLPTLPSAWMTQLDAQLQQRVVNEVRATRLPCAIRNDGLLSFWMKGSPVPDLPLVRYINTAFRPTEQVGGYVFMLPRTPRS